MLSHELRTPLTPVLMTIAALRREPDLNEDLRRDLEVLQRNVELEALLIDDLLDLTRIAHGKLELHSDAVDVHGTIDHALSISAGDLSGKEHQRDPPLRSAGTSLLGRPGALAAGLLEPGQERGEIYSRRRPARDLHQEQRRNIRS